MFDPACTMPPEGVGFVGSPHIRGTFQIVWSCVLVLVTCTWSILHLNIPPQSTVRPGSWAHTRRGLLRTWTKIKWMMFTLLAPEYALGKAWSDRRCVKTLEKRFEAISQLDGVPWSATHTHFANMGGFAVRFASVGDEDTDPSDPEAQAAEPRDAPEPEPEMTEAVPTSAPWKDSQRLLDEADNDDDATAPTPSLEAARFDGVGADEGDKDLDDDAHGEAMRRHLCDDIRRHINGSGLRDEVSAAAVRAYAAALARKIGDVDWHVDAANSALVSAALRTVAPHHFAGLGEFYRFAEFAQRWARNARVLRGSVWVLDAHQLLLARELGIVGALPRLAADDLADRNKQDLFFKALALGQIGWFVVQIAVRLSRGVPAALLEVLVLAFAVSAVVTYYLLLDKPGSVTYTVTLPAVRRPCEVSEIVRLAVLGPATVGKFRNSIWIPNNSTHLDTELTPQTARGPLVQTAFASASSVFLFGLIHLIGWNFTFPTEAEKLLWHASSILTAVGIPAAVVVIMGLESILLGQNWFRDVLRGLVVYTSFAPFVVARIFILVEVFRSLAFLPPGTFITTWAS